MSKDLSYILARLESEKKAKLEELSKRKFKQLKQPTVHRISDDTSRYASELAEQTRRQESMNALLALAKQETARKERASATELKPEGGLTPGLKK